MEDQVTSGDLQTYYDFMQERMPILILGGYAIEGRTLERSLSSRVLSFLFFFLKQSLHIVIILLAVITVLMTFDQRAIQGQALFSLVSIGGGMVVTSIRYIVTKDLHESIEILKTGIYIYNEIIDNEYRKIKNKRVKNIKLIQSVGAYMFFSCAFVYVTIFPTVKLFFFNMDAENSIVNPYFPIPIYIPFDTSSATVFSLIYFFSCISLISSYATFVCHLQFYSSLAEHLQAEYEVLIFSLDNIQRRAFLELNGDRAAEENQTYQRCLKNDDYQESLYSCLRRNVIHHQAILRYKKVMATYLEGTNTVAIMLFSILMAASMIPLLEDPKKNLLLSMAFFGTSLGYLPMCWLGQEITNLSDDLFHSFFSTPWPDCSVKFKVLMKIAHVNSIRPVVLQDSALNVNVSLKTFGDLVSLAYKFVNLVR